MFNEDAYFSSCEMIVKKSHTELQETKFIFSITILTVNRWKSQRLEIMILRKYPPQSVYLNLPVDTITKIEEWWMDRGYSVFQRVGFGIQLDGKCAPRCAIRQEWSSYGRGKGRVVFVGRYQRSRILTSRRML